MTINGLLVKIQGILDTVVPFIIGLGVFVIIWGIITYVLHAGEEEKRTEARMYVVWGIIGVFMMLSIWGFVNILYKSFGLDNEFNSANIPRVPPIQSGSNGDMSGGDGGNNGNFGGGNGGGCVDDVTGDPIDCP